MKGIQWILISIVLTVPAVFATAQDSITIAVAPAYDSVSNFHRFLFGENYRKEWATPVKLRVVNLSQEKGGLKVIEKGGGLQTKSLRLEDPRGKEWVIRSIQKYPERGLPPKLRKSIAKDILQDQVVTSHPFAALTVPFFAKALDLEHHNPEIVYIKDDPVLGEHRADFANTVMMLEERQPLHFDKTINTEKLQEKLSENIKNRINAKKLLRARLLDLVIGDWDRHEDQWRWAEDPEDNFQPIPKDRDKVFYTTSGLLPGLLSKQSTKANLQGFNHTISRINQYNYNNRFFDRYFLNTLNEEDWHEEIRFVQSTLTDNLIEKAVRIFPPAIYKLSGEKITHTLKKRRDHLEEFALRYFYDLAAYIDFAGSKKKETFLIEYQKDGAIMVEVRNDDSLVIYQRKLSDMTTREIRLYSLGGSDNFILKGEHKNRTKIFLIGGKGSDRFSIDPGVKNRRRIMIYDNTEENNILPESSQFRNRLNTDTAVHDYDIKNFVYDKVGPFVNAFFNLDLGLTIGAGIVEQRQGFRKKPYANRQVLAGNYSISRGSLMFTYDAEIKEAVGKNDLLINFISRGPRNVSNFFGLGNNSSFPDAEDKKIDYYRNRYDVMTTSVGLSRNLSKYLTVQASAGLQYYTSDYSNNKNKFLSEFNVKHPGQDVFSDKLFTSFTTGFIYNRTKTALLPDKGLLWKTFLTGMQQVDGEKHQFSKLESDMVFYIEVNRQESFVLANRLGGGFTKGNPTFFQQFHLGGPNNLRGYAINRFTGSSAFYHNIEARIKLFDFNSYLFPGTFGLTTFHDIGRVWTSNEKSGTWHRGYGAGLFLLPADVMVIQVLMAWSKEGRQPYVSLGMSF